MIFICFDLTIWTPCICMFMFNFYSYFVDIKQDLVGPKRTRIPEKTRVGCVALECHVTPG